MSGLPNASQCLNECESHFARSYGANLERLQAIKGSKEEESVLLVRMHLLQAITSFHSGHVRQAEELFNSVNRELVDLQVPQDLLEEVVAAGFSRTEARLALRVTKNNVAIAVRYAQEMRNKRLEVELQEKERTAKRKKFGRTPSGDWINLGYLATLTKMGYEEKLAALALRHCDNDIKSAIGVINENPELLIAEDNMFDAKKDITEEMISTVVAMGFKEKDVKRALVHCEGNAEQAIEALTSGKAFDSNPTSSSGESSTDSESEANKEQVEEAMERMKEDLDTADGYLDLSLDEEKAYLDKYLKIVHRM